MKFLHSTHRYSRTTYTVELSGEERAQYTDQQLINICDGGFREHYKDQKDNFGGVVRRLSGDTYAVVVYTD